MPRGIKTPEQADRINGQRVILERVAKSLGVEFDGLQVKSIGRGKVLLYGTKEAQNVMLRHDIARPCQVDYHVETTVPVRLARIWLDTRLDWVKTKTVRLKDSIVLDVLGDSI
jgi:hypothetical protein